MVVLVTCKSLNTLQRLKGFLQSLNRLCRRLSRLAQANVRAVLYPSKLMPSRFRGTFAHRFLISSL